MYGTFGYSAVVIYSGHKKNFSVFIQFNTPGWVISAEIHELRFRQATGRFQFIPLSKNGVSQRVANYRASMEVTHIEKI
jgi:hypothetical protein